MNIDKNIEILGHKINQMTFHPEGDNPSLPSIDELKTLFSGLGLRNYEHRDYYTRHSFFVLSDDFFKSLVKHVKNNNIKEIFDIGCGSGLFSFWLRVYLKKKKLDKKIKVSPIDKRDSHYTPRWKITDFVDDVIVSDALDFITENNEKDTVLSNNEKLYIMSWPNMESDFAFDVLDSIPVDSQLLYIGEGMGGCTATSAFHTTVDVITNHDSETVFPSIRYFGIHDYPTLYKKHRQLTNDERQIVKDTGEYRTGLEVDIYQEQSKINVIVLKLEGIISGLEKTKNNCKTFAEAEQVSEQIKEVSDLILNISYSEPYYWDDSDELKLEKIKECVIAFSNKLDDVVKQYGEPTVIPSSDEAERSRIRRSIRM